MKKLALIIVFINFLYSQEETVASFQKQKQEVVDLKKELSQFYELKEKEYTQRKAELEKILKNIENQKREIENIKSTNLKILKGIKQEVKNKTSSIYNNMKPKVSAPIFNQMIADGKIQDVFDIIIGLNEKKVTSIMKYMSIENSAELTLMLKNYGNKAKEGK